MCPGFRGFDMMTDLLLHLESEAIVKIRDVFDHLDGKVALFITDGMASDVLRSLVKKAIFPFSPEYSLVYINDNSTAPSTVASAADFLDRLRAEENVEIIVKSCQEMVELDPHFNRIDKDQLSNFALKTVVETHKFQVLVTGLQWQQKHPWVDHDLIFRQGHIQRVEPLGNWTQRDLENYAYEKISRYTRAKVRVS